ncbi:hypothetical protein Lepto7375DRAFT_7533 [Leptolyngbya sp. PCC 7375]|nr:hypothetical protein Lepto7375DRAFT_7533 [Leptolyngbya sp. PCC 7375]
MLHPLMTNVPTLLLSARERGKEMIEEINQKCVEKKVPQAFDVGSIKDARSPDEIHFRCHPNFRFEGFGMDVGLPPKFTFWVWYKKGYSDGVEIGKFQVKMNLLSQIAFNLIPLGSIEGLIGRVDEVADVVEELTGSADSGHK